MAEYKIQLPVFEGPLDLLLYLIKKEEVDIYEVNLTRIATQFVEYLEQMKRLDLDVAGEFVVMAATLIWIKSKELLPVDQRPLTDLDEENNVDPRWELIRKLVEYKKFKEAASELQRCEAEQENCFPHQSVKQEFPPDDFEQQGPKITLMDLLQAVNDVLARMKERGVPQEIVGERWTVREKITFLKNVLREKKKVNFLELLEQSYTRFEVVVTFLAVLELARLHEIWVEQSHAFGEIDILDAAE